MKLNAKKRTLLLLTLASSIALSSCGTPPLSVRAAEPICPSPPKPPKALTDPIDIPSFLSGN